MARPRRPPSGSGLRRPSAGCTVRAPVWLNQGRNDTRTPPGQAQAYADALRAAGGDVLIEWFEGGHTIPGLDRALADQERMFELVDRRLRGLRWDELGTPG